MNADSAPRPRIYQLLVRTFGNTNATRKPYGSMEENGCGKFADINEAALASLKEMGFTHLWLTGVLEQASTTSYPNRPADHPELVKGRAGSPYAIRDTFDVSPDYAVDPERRLEEFQDLLDRCHARGFRVLIDFVPNHVARSYASDVRPDLSFGNGDDPSVFFLPSNNFYYLKPWHLGGGAPLVLPHAVEGVERYEEWNGRVSGNNVVHWQPGLHDWYETVKLNYGHDFTTGRATFHLPPEDADLDQVPKTWRMMDAIIGYWQDLGVDGFRVDMAHMIPMEFWRWLLRRAHQRGEVYFMAEAYDNDPAKLTDGPVLEALLDAGFDAVYDDPIYDLLMGIYDEGKWCNDLDAFIFTGARFHRSLRYGENHDEVRLAHPNEWGGHGMRVGKPVCAVLFSLGRGPVMVYHGQEVGEEARAPSGFADDNARTTIFDYTSLPALCAWMNGGAFDGAGLSREQAELRDWYGRLLRLMSEPAFEDGDFYGLNFANRDNPRFGRLDGESTSGHWLYAFLRRDAGSGQAFLVMANFHPQQTLGDLRVIIPEDVQEWLALGPHVSLTDRLDTAWTGCCECDELARLGVVVPALPPLSAVMLEMIAT